MHVIAIVEEAVAMFNLHDIARSMPRLDALVFGSVDFRRSAGMPAVFSCDTELDGVVERPHYEQQKTLLKRASDIND